MKLDSYDAKTRKATYKGNTPITDSRGLDFTVHVTLPDPRMANQQISMSLDLGSYEADTFDDVRHRMALWLRNVAEALEGEVEGSLPVRVKRLSKEAVQRPRQGEEPQPGDLVAYHGEDYSIERLAARDQVKLTGEDTTVFVPLSVLVWDHGAGQWYVDPDWRADTLSPSPAL